MLKLYTVIYSRGSPMKKHIKDIRTIDSGRELLHEGQTFSDFDLHSKSQEHESRFSLYDSNITSNEISEKLMKNKEN